MNSLMTSLAHSTFRSAALLAAALLTTFLSGCGPYTIQGRVVRGSFPAVMVVPADDPRLEEGTAVSGVTVAAIRDASTMNRAKVGSATSDAGGLFSLPISALGAGITDEEWLITASRSGYARVESSLRLPGSAGGSRLLIQITPGSSDRSDPGTSPEDVAEEIERYFK
jgi:hypothetical protein